MKVINHKVVGEVKISSTHSGLYYVYYTPAIDLRGATLREDDMPSALSISYKGLHAHRCAPWKAVNKFMGKGIFKLEEIQDFLDTLTPEYFEELQKEFDKHLEKIDARLAEIQTEKEYKENILNALH
jgi:hypothetical protein